MSEQKVLLELKKLKKYFPVSRGVYVKAVEDVSFKVYEGEKFGVVGESGCGKSTLGRLLLQLYPQTSGASIYYGKALPEMCPMYLVKEIKQLQKYQKKAVENYQKSLKYDMKIKALEVQAEALEAMGTKSETRKYNAIRKKISSNEYLSLEARKDASRELREGSRTVGSLILCEKLPEIQELFFKGYKETKAASDELVKYQKLESTYELLRIEGKEDLALIQEMEASVQKRNAHIEKAKEYRKIAWDENHGKNILPITERALDKDYQIKLDGNYEKGINLGKLKTKEMREIRKEMQMIFQDPAASLDPRQTIGQSIEEVYVINTDFTKEVRKEKVLKLLDEVGLKKEHYDYYPHSLSGGQKQRVGIARAIALETKFIVLDESVSALDVSVQAQVLKLLNELSEEKKLTYFFITHDLGVVKHFCDRILVMYLGNICEFTTSGNIFAKQLHPYTKSLIASVPRIKVNKEHSTELILDGDVPSAMNPPKGCPFHTRCNKCMDICRVEKPIVKEVEPEHFVACHLYNEEVK